MADLQQSDVLGSYLSNFYAARQQQQAQQDRDRQMQRQDAQDAMAQQEHDWIGMQRKNEYIGRVAMAADTPEKWQQIVPQAAQQLGWTGPIPEFGERNRILSESMSVAEQIKQKMDERKFALDQRQTEAQIRASDASAAASRANADYIRGAKTAAATGGGAAGMGKPLTEGQAKDLGYLKRGEAVNTMFTPQVEKALTNDVDAVKRAIPVVGQRIQSDASRQATQIAKNFVAVVLRKDTGAAVTPQEFDFYADIFIPQWGDDAGTLQQKVHARQTFLDALRAGLGAKAALAQMGIAPPEGLAPADDAPAAELRGGLGDAPQGQSPLDLADSIVGLKR